MARHYREMPPASPHNQAEWIGVEPEGLLGMATDNESLVLSISADTRQIQRQLKSLIGQTERDTKAIEQAFTGSGAKAASSFDGVATNSARAFTTAEQASKRFQSAMRASTAQTGNLAAQLNDIGVQLAGGQSPFLIALQQGSQITQALGSGTGARGAVAALGGAFTSLLNPVSLATIAIIGLGGGAVQYFTELLSNTDKSAKALEDEAKLIQTIVDKWGEALPALKRYNDERNELANAAQRDVATQSEIDKQYQDVQQAVKDARIELTDFIDKIRDSASDTEISQLQAAFKALSEGVQATDADVAALRTVQKALNDIYASSGIPVAREFSDQLGEMADKLGDAVKRTRELRLENERLDLAEVPTTGQSQGGRVRYRSTVLPESVSTPEPRPLDDYFMPPSGAAKTIRDAYGAIDSFVERVVRAESNGIANAKNPNSSATGVGQFIESTWLDLFRRYFPQEASDMSRQAILGLRGDAERSRQLIEVYARENAAVLQKAGVSVDEAALQLAHFLGAGDAAKVLSAAPGTPLAGLISQASIKANPTILGDGRTVDDAIAYGRRRSNETMAPATPKVPRKTPDQIFQGDVEQIQRRIEVLNAEYEAQSKVNPLVEDYGFKVEQARIKQQLLNEAEKAGVQITPELAAQIDTLATNYATASSSADRLRDSQQQAAEAAREVAQFGREAVGGLISDLLRGEDASKALANALSRVGDRLLDIGLDALFGGGTGSGGGGLLGGLLGSLFGKREHGGPVTAGKPYIVGEKRPELFVPSQSGRIVPRLPTVKKAGGGSVHATYSPSIDMRGASAEAVARLENVLARDKAEFSARVVKTVREAKKSRALD